MTDNAKVCACYLRVSTDKQTVANQLAEVRRLAVARGYEPAVYTETESAVKARPVLEEMLADVRAGRVGAVCVWSLDRLGRGFQCFDLFRELTRLGVRVLSVREPWTDVDGPARELLVAVMAWVAGFERERLIERTRAGLERAKQQGVRLGRPCLSPLKLAAAVQDVEHGMSQRGAAKNRGISEAALRKHLHAHLTPASPTPRKARPQ